MPGAASLGERIRVLGRVDDADLFPLYRGAALFALPSRHEGFGLPVLEAMGQGTPVLCSDVPPLVELVGAAAELVPARRGAVGRRDRPTPRRPRPPGGAERGAGSSGPAS